MSDTCQTSKVQHTNRRMWWLWVTIRCYYKLHGKSQPTEEPEVIVYEMQLRCMRARKDAITELKSTRSSLLWLKFFVWDTTGKANKADWAGQSIDFARLTNLTQFDFSICLLGKKKTHTKKTTNGKQSLCCSDYRIPLEKSTRKKLSEKKKKKKVGF